MINLDIYKIEELTLLDYLFWEDTNIISISFSKRF
jgi:hypothetical protein